MHSMPTELCMPTLLVLALGQKSQLFSFGSIFGLGEGLMLVLEIPLVLTEIEMSALYQTL